LSFLIFSGKSALNIKPFRKLLFLFFSTNFLFFLLKKEGQNFKSAFFIKKDILINLHAGTCRLVPG